jgi:hypothetical protein
VVQEKVAFHGVTEVARLMDFGLEMPHTGHHSPRSRSAVEEGAGLLGVRQGEAEKWAAHVEEQNS